MPLTVTPSRVAPVYPEDSEIYDMVAGTALTLGQAVRFNPTTGRAVLAGGGTAVLSKARGIASAPGTVGAGQAVSVIKRGYVQGYDVSALDYGAIIYLENGLGEIGTAPGTVSVAIGTVGALPDSTATKCLYVDFDWTR